VYILATPFPGLRCVNSRNLQNMADKMNCEWFATWFDSPYYHLLYRNRDFVEAEAFITRLLHQIQLPAQAQVLDLACGKGRHSIFLHRSGLKVLGIDLSKESIALAKKHEIQGLHFEVQDMRHFEAPSCEAIFNLFTSFGYFDNVRDNKMVLAQVAIHLQEGGSFVLDYFNSVKVQAHMKPHYYMEIEGVEFNILKKVMDGKIIKSIHIKDGSNEFDFEEKVQLFSLSEIIEMITEAGMQVVNTFGDYLLNGFEAENSDRVIVIARK
jgi:cyclopropane fatty-acyl-phospholipid synthase-like methyltransferase